MMTQEIHVDTLIFELNRFLDAGQISLSQLANQLGVSKGHLSEIKNGKTLPALNLGLRILKICGLDTTTRRRWAHVYNLRVSEEYLEVHEKFDSKENAVNLNERISTLLANDLNLMNAYVDIVNRESVGISQEELMVEYGRDVLKKLKTLVKEDVVIQDDRMFKVGKCSPVITRNASYDLMKEIIDDQKEKFQHGELKGKFKFEINDLDEAGFQELSSIFDEAMKKAQEVIGKRKVTRQRGGSRYVFQMMMGQLKSLVLIFGLMFSLMSFNSSFEAHAQPMETSYGNTLSTSGGLAGGSSSHLTEQEKEMLDYIEDLFKNGEREIDWNNLENESGFKFVFPSMYIEGIKLSVNKVCKTRDDMLRSTTPERVCKRWKNVRYECFQDSTGMHQCTKLEDNSVVIGNEKIERECVEYGFDFVYKSNLEAKVVTIRDARGLLKRTIELVPGKTDFSVDILGRDQLAEKIIKKAEKNYSIPSCKLFDVFI
ncbi:MAG: hypothetical protein OHK0056_11190 [Bacteriovoracaceae bacterium]